MEDSDPPRLDPGGVSVDTVPVGVANGKVGGVQLCPALVLNTPMAIQPAVKHVYSRIAASASELDQGIADVLIVLVGNGNTLSQTYLDKVETVLARLISKCGVWLLSSGESTDPLAKAASHVIRTVLPQLETDSEVLHIGVNSSSVVPDGSHRHSGFPEETTPMVDVSVNTLLALCRGISEETSIANFRAHFAVRLVHPPPALLIGVPHEGHTASTGFTPISPSSPPILLSPSNDSRPLPVVIFSGQSLASLHELLVYVQNGFPVVVLQDSCELCDTLYNAWLLYRSPSFEYGRFMEWLNGELEGTVEDGGNEENGENPSEIVAKIFSIAFSDTQLIEFLSADDISSLPARLVEMCANVHPDPLDTKRALVLAGKLNLPRVLNSIDVNSVMDDELLQDLLVQALSHEDNVDFLAALLEREGEITVTGELLLRVLNASDQHFFNTIVMCQCLGYSSTLSEIDDSFCRSIEELLHRLSHGVHSLFPLSLSSSLTGGTAIQCLAVWTLLLHRPSHSKCLLAHSDHPLSTALILSRIAKSLSVEAHDWFFYEESLQQTSQSLSQFALSLLESVHSKSPTKSYQVLCQPLEAFNGTTLTQIAFQAHNQHFLAHECCQRWVHRLLYGHLQIRSGAFPAMLPKWMKLVVSAFLVFPTRFWVAIRPSQIQPQEKRCTSPTVALLEAGRAPKKVRAFSTYSMVSGRSDAFTNLTHPLLPQSAPAAPMLLTHLHNGGESVTPQSMVLPLTIEETDTPHVRGHKKKHRHRRRWTAPPLTAFYSTPIVKYWVSLVFRLMHILLFAYSILLPGCGSTILDTVVWVWSLMAWIEQLYVVWTRSQSMPLKEMPWRVFDVGITFVFLVGMFVLKLFGDQMRADFLPFQSVYWARVLTAFFLLYFCYATLFTYVPLSELFGPIVVRVKLMILRDFVNFLIMVALIMISSGVAVHSILYPDQPLTIPVVQKTISWAWLSIFSTDLSGLQESDRCKKSFLGAPREFCSGVGQHGDVTCPRQGWAGYVAVIEYFILLKLILWPILFAFFAKTAKAVEDEADKIWKYQMYALVTDFSIRPCVPPPLTPLFFIAAACCRANSFFSCCITQTSSDHPDMVDGCSHRKYSVYRNPSVPFKRFEFLHAFWRQTAIAKWKSSRNEKGDGNSVILSEIRHIRAQLRLVGLNSSYEKTAAAGKTMKLKKTYMDTPIKRLVIEEDKRAWPILSPAYSPPFYSKPMEEFSIETQRYVDVTTQQNVDELRRLWRAKQAQEQPGTTSTVTLSGGGFPLNPSGRTGLAGRGVHAKFGGNQKVFYIIISGSGYDAKLLLHHSALPSEWRYETGSRDEHLTAILVNIGIAEGEAQVLSTRRLEGGVSDTGPAHIFTGPAPAEEDTDHAWTEQDVWAVCLRARRVSASPPTDYHWTALSTSALSPEQTQWLKKAREVFAL